MPRTHWAAPAVTWDASCASHSQLCVKRGVECGFSSPHCVILTGRASARGSPALRPDPSTLHPWKGALRGSQESEWSPYLFHPSVQQLGRMIGNRWWAETLIQPCPWTSQPNTGRETPGQVRHTTPVGRGRGSVPQEPLRRQVGGGAGQQQEKVWGKGNPPGEGGPRRGAGWGRQKASVVLWGCVCFGGRRDCLGAGTRVLNPGFL